MKAAYQIMSLRMRQTAKECFHVSQNIHEWKQHRGLPWIIQVEILKLNRQVPLTELQRSILKTCTVVTAFNGLRWIIFIF